MTYLEHNHKALCLSGVPNQTADEIIAVLAVRFAWCGDEYRPPDNDGRLRLLWRAAKAEARDELDRWKNQQR